MATDIIYVKFPIELTLVPTSAGSEYLDCNGITGITSVTCLAMPSLTGEHTKLKIILNGVN